MPATTLGGVLNAGLKVMREPEISELTASNILQTHLIEVVNDAVAELRADGDWPWTYQYTTLTTAAEHDTGYAAVTNGSTTVTSVDADGADDTEFGSVTSRMWFRAAGDNTSYGIASVDSSSTPNTLTLDTAYVGTTSTASGYRCFQDTYALETSGVDRVVSMVLGEVTSWTGAIGGFDANREIEQITLQAMLQMSGGDGHLDTSGRPRFFTGLQPSSDPYRRVLLWPAPDDEYVVGVWYTTDYADAMAFDTALLGTDAPDRAYAALEHRCRSAARLWERDSQTAAYWEQMFQQAKADLHRREAREVHNRGMHVETGRRSHTRYPINFGEVFDRKSARRY